VHYAFGVFLLREDADAALAEFNRELRISPLHVEAMLQIALEKNLRAEHEEGLALAQKAVEIAPRNSAGRNVLGRILLTRDDVDGAIQQLEEGARLAPLSREMHFELARAYARAGRKEDAPRAEIFRSSRKRRRRQEPRPAGGRGGRARLEREAARVMRPTAAASRAAAAPMCEREEGRS
jgi:predicted Zn-dependent protease